MALFKKDKKKKDKKLAAKIEEPKTIDTTQKSIGAPKKVNNDDTTQRYLPFSEIRDNVIFMKDGSARIVLKVETVNFALKSEEEQDAIIFAYQRFLNSLQFPIQISVRSLKVDIDGYINKLNTMGANQSNYLLKEQTSRYVEFLGNLVDVAQIMKKEFYLIIPHDENDALSVKRTTFMGTIKNFYHAVFGQAEDLSKMKAQRSRIDNLKKKSYEKANIIRSSLDSIGLRSRALNKNELIELMMSYYNPKMDSVAKLGDTIDQYDLADA